MEKQSLSKYYCALLLVLVILAGSNNAVAQTYSPTSSPTPKAAIVTSPGTTQSREKLIAKPDNNTWLPLILSMIALAVSGGAIALTIFKNKKINDRIQSDNEKYNPRLKLLENKCAELLAFPTNSQSSQQQESISRTSSNYNNTNTYLESSISDLSVRITKLEDKLKATPNNQQSNIFFTRPYLSNQSHNQEPDFNTFNQVEGLYQSNNTQSLGNHLAYIDLVNIYRDNPRLLEQKAIKVSEDKDSIARRHTDSSHKIVLEKANNSNYWVIHDDIGIDCWLLPKSKLRIDQFRYETTKALFECNGYQPEYSTFKLIKPAKVIPLSADEQTWQLEEQGILEFTVEV